MARISYTREYDVRRVETWEADVPDEFLREHAPDGIADSVLDQYICDNGDADMEDYEPVGENDNLEYSITKIEWEDPE